MRHVPVGACADRTAHDARSLASAAAVTLARMCRSRVHSAALLAALATAVLTFAPSAALAQVGSGDASATRAYLQADYAATRAEVKSFPTAIAAVEALEKQVQSECPGVLAGAPKAAPGTAPSATTAEISEEELDAAFTAAERTELTRRRGFAHVVSRLRWSNAALTRLVRESAASEAAKAAIPPPSLCADMRTWVASGYRAVSAGTQLYLHRESVATKAEGAQDAIKRKLARYESAADKRIVHKIDSIEHSAFPAMLTKFFAVLGKLGEALATAAPTG